MIDNRINLLIVDDHMMFVEGLTSLLEVAEDIRVVAHACTADEALAAVEAHNPDVVLLDHVLPDADGVDVASQILSSLPETRVVMLTQLVDEVTASRAVHAGCVGYVTKDKPITELIEAIRTVAEGEVAVSPHVLIKMFERVRSGATSVPSLSVRESEILQLLTNGLATAAIAKELSLSLSTVRNHIQSVLQKLDAHSMLEAVVIGLREGLTTPPRRQS
ncbi:MAG TPA: response regulator transcription factor [Actinomycetota bacterium]|nr:response regulator transcription factor [Actinomycetota bacterium]